MATFTSAATCYEVPDTRQEGLDDNGPTASVRLQCAYDDRWTIINDLLANGRLWPFSIGSYLPCIARSASVVPLKEEVGSTDQAYNWITALIDVTYGVPKLEDRVVFAEEIAPGANFVTLNPYGFVWGNNKGMPLKDEEAPGFQDVTSVWRLTRYRQTSIPAYLDTLYGKCNNAPISPATLPGFTFAAERVVLASWKASRSTNLLYSGATDTWDVTAELAIKRNSWNQFLRSESGSYQSIFIKNGIRFTPYPLDDFTTMITP